MRTVKNPLTSKRKIVRVAYYFDYKSPYAYLADHFTWALAEQSNIELDWIPYTLKIEKYLGNAELDANDRDICKTRNDHQWRRVRYSYRDCRREATRRGLIIRGPRKIFDSSLAHVAFLWASSRGETKKFHDSVFKMFWMRELDIENIGDLISLMNQNDLRTEGFEEFAISDGIKLHDRLQTEAELNGVFGVPSWIVEGELFWGLERLVRVKENLT